MYIISVLMVIINIIMIIINIKFIMHLNKSLYKNIKEINDYKTLVLYASSGRNKLYDTVDKKIINICEISEKYNEFGYIIVKITDDNGNVIVFKPNRFIVPNKAAI